MFVCRHPTLVLRVGSVGRDFFLFWWRSVLFQGSYRFLLFFIIKFVFLSWFLWLIYYEVEMSLRLYADQRNEGIRFKPQTLEAFQNDLILICHCEIYPYYVYILFNWKSKCSRDCYFYVIIFFISFCSHVKTRTRTKVSWSLQLTWGFNKIKTLKLFVYFF